MVLSWARASVFVVVLGMLWGAWVHVVALKCNSGTPGKIVEATCSGNASADQERCIKGTVGGVVRYGCDTITGCSNAKSIVPDVTCCDTNLCNTSGAAKSTPMVAIMVGSVMSGIYFAMQ